MQIIIIHYKPLADRHEYYQNTKFFMNSNLRFLKADDREEINWCFNTLFFSQQQSAWAVELKELIPILLFNSGMTTSILPATDTDLSSIPDWAKARQLKESEISLIYKHHLALLLASHNEDPTFILEDDALLKPDTVDRIPSILSEFKESKLDYLDLAGGCNLPMQSSEVANSSGITYLNIPRSRTTAGYLVSPKAALKLGNALFPISLPLDWSFQKIFLRYNFKVGWCIPELFRHGSQDIYTSSIQ